MDQLPVLIEELALPSIYIAFLRREVNTYHYDLFPLMSAPLTVLLIDGLPHRDRSILVHFQLKDIEHVG